MSKLEKYIVVFDLDDTLFAEIDYQKSGYEYLKYILSKQFNKKINIDIDKFIRGKKQDFLRLICERINVPLSVKDSLLWQYRLHEPNIFLRDDIKYLIQKLKDLKIKTAIITDGRSITQRIKINKLKLNKMPLLISEEYESCKPEPLRFQIIMKRWPNKKYVYIGDNISKDFHSPMELGWYCIGANWFKEKLYKNLSFNHNLVEPHLWLSDPIMVMDVLEDL